MINFLNQYGADILSKTGQHIYISAVALALGIIVAVPLGMLLTRAPKISGAVIGLASVMQTIPALALLAIMIPIFGIGSTPAIVALFIYSLLPILRNTYLGLTSVDPALIDAAKGMGMNSFQRMWKVELQLALR